VTHNRCCGALNLKNLWFLLVCIQITKTNLEILLFLLAYIQIKKTTMLMLCMSLLMWYIESQFYIESGQFSRYIDFLY